MTITPTTLTRYAATAAVTAGLLFIGVQIDHPHLDAESITTTEMAIRSSGKVLMAALALVGITGMYLRQVKETGLLGFLGYAVFGAGYLMILGTSYASAYVLPTVAESNPHYVDHVIAAATGRGETGDIGVLTTVLQVQGFAYLVGGLLFGIALYRARVLTRWAAALLAVSGPAAAALTVLPDAFYRLLAFPNAVAMIALGYSLWQSTRTGATPSDSTVPAPRPTPAGAR
jgi:hypothetical protein